MDPSEFPFGVEAYKRQSEIEERYIINRFREQRNQIEEGYTPRVKRKSLHRDHATANQRLIDNYFANQRLIDDYFSNMDSLKKKQEKNDREMNIS
jgi:hypothetical protein